MAKVTKKVQPNVESFNLTLSPEEFYIILTLLNYAECDDRFVERECIDSTGNITSSQLFFELLREAGDIDYDYTYDDFIQSLNRKVALND